MDKINLINELKEKIYLLPVITLNQRTTISDAFSDFLDLKDVNELVSELKSQDKDNFISDILNEINRLPKINYNLFSGFFDVKLFRRNELFDECVTKIILRESVISVLCHSINIATESVIQEQEDTLLSQVTNQSLSQQNEEYKFYQGDSNDSKWHELNTVESADASKYLGYLAREYNGSRFGSYPLCDDYSDESSP